ncbi:MAG: oxidoreductase [Asticcacaulis sp.]
MLNTALIGYGYAGKTFHAPLIRAADGLKLTTVVSSRPADVHADIPDIRVSDFDTVLNDPTTDLVVIATPNDLHAPQALAALKAGKHVVIDKPFCLDLTEAEALIAQASASDRLLSVFHNRRWDSDFLTLKRLISEDKLGDISLYVSRFDRFRPFIRNRWREAPVKGAGLWYDLGPHLIDQALQLFGAPERLSLDLAQQRTGSEVDDYFHATLSYGQKRVILEANVMTPAPGPRFEVHGSKASFVKFGLDTQEATLKTGGTPEDIDFGIDDREGLLTPVLAGDHVGTAVGVASEKGNYSAYYAKIAKAISTRAPNPVPAEDALAVMRIIELGRQSASENRVIQL